MAQFTADLARRAFLGRSAQGVGAFALTSMLADSVNNTALGKGVEVKKWKGVVTKPHSEPKAKRVIFLCQAGGASHLETYDWKPKLAEMHGKPMPESFTKGQPIAQLQGKKLTCLKGGFAIE